MQTYVQTELLQVDVAYLCDNNKGREKKKYDKLFIRFETKIVSQISNLKDSGKKIYLKSCVPDYS